MKKWLGLLLAVVMVLCMVTTSFAATAAEQVTYAGNTWYYTAAGAKTENTTFPGGNAVVELSKTVASTGVENEFEVLLMVRTTQDIRELHSDTPDAAVMLIMDVSNSMDDCDLCGQEASHQYHQDNGQQTTLYYCNGTSGTQYERGQRGCQHCGKSRDQHNAVTVRYDHEYVSRLSKAKAAAVAFLDNFAKQTGVEEGDKRWVAIVDFGSTAYTRLTWVDVTNDTQLAAAKAAINNLTVAHSDLDGEEGRPNVSDSGGTNIEGALMLGANVWGSNSTVAAVDYKYTILLTDGNPTFHVEDGANDRNSTTQIKGSAGGSSTTYLSDAKDVGDEADRILNLSGLSRLYSICYGSVTEGGTTTRVWDKTAFGNWNEANPATTSSMTIGQWLEAFSTKAYDGATGNNLFDSFNSVISQIQLATQAWKVNDTMGTHVVWGGEVKQNNVENQSRFTGNNLYWDVLSSDYASVSNQGSYTILTYTYKYKITLDNLDKSYNGGETPANAQAELTFAVKDPSTELWSVQPEVAFPVPEVKGYEGALTFDKGYLSGNTFVPMEDVVFTLTSKDKSAEGVAWTATATSDDTGKVTFTGIPSGHDYALTEAVPAGYAAPGEMDVSVKLGETTFNKVNAQHQLINVKSEKDVTLVLKKAFGSKDHPASITFTIVNTAADYSRTVTLSAANEWTTTLLGLPEGNYVITEQADYPGYDMEAEATLTKGNDTTSTSQLNTDYNNVKVNLTAEGQNSHQEYTVQFTNTYTQQVGDVSVEKSFWERDYDDLLAGSEDPEMVPLDVSAMNALEVTIELIDANGKVAAEATLSNAEGWSAEFDDLPVGEYTIKEITETVIPDYEFIHLHVLVDGVASESNKITVGKNSNIKLKLENHYTRHMGDIRIVKTLNGIAADDIPAGHTFLVDVYATENGQQTDNLVTTITVAKLESGEWTGTSKDIPVGLYWLEERTPKAIDGYNFRSGVFSSQTVAVQSGSVTATVVLTNTYEQQTGQLTVRKVFDIPKNPQNDFVRPESITVQVLDDSDSGNVVETLTLTAQNDWTANVTLPLGSYHLAEIVASGVAGTADVPNFGLAATWSPSSGVSITKDNYNQANGFSYTVTNKYTENYGTVTISKEFAGDTLPQELMNKATIVFVIYEKDEDGTMGDVVESVTLSSANDWTKTLDLPVGDYFIFEYGAHNAFENYTLTSVQINGENWYSAPTAFNTVSGYPFSVSKYEDADDLITLHAVNTYQKDTASLTIAKAFGEKSDLTKDTFSGSIDVLIYNNGVQVGAPVTLNADNQWSKEVSGLDVGVKYTLVEVHTKGAENTAYRDDYTLEYSWSGGAEVTLAKQAEGATPVIKTVTNTYTKKTGAMKVTKIFSGMTDEDVALLDNASITLNITGGGENKTITLDKAGRWTSEITLPVGTYTITEEEIKINGYTHKDALFTSASGQVTDGGANTRSATVEIKPDQTAAVGVTLTNTMERDLGKLTINKVFDFEVGSELNESYFANKKIDVQVYHEDHLYQTVTLNAANSWSVTLENVPTGSYKVQEVTSAGATNTAHVDGYGLHVEYTNHGDVNVVKGTTPATMTVTNKYTQHVGYIKVTKTFGTGANDVDSLAAEKLIPDTGIAIQVYDDKGNPEDTLYVSRQNGGTTDLIELAVGTYKLVEVTEKGEPGTAYVDGYILSSSWGDGIDVTVTENHTATLPMKLEVNNTYTRNVGSLTITKAFAGCKDIVKPTAITVYVKKDSALYKVVTLPVKNAQTGVDEWSVTLTDLPVGVYTVEEGPAEVEYHSLAVTYSAEQIAVDPGKQENVTITNTYTHQNGNLTITKEFADGSALGKANFAGQSINVLVKRNGTEYRIVTLPVKNEQTDEDVWTVTLANLPLGNYTVEEVIEPGAANTAYRPGYGLSVTYNGQQQGNVTVAANQTTTMKVENKYDRVILNGTLTIKKAFAPDSALNAAHFGSIDVRVKGNGGEMLVTLKAENDWTWTGVLPLGYYTVTEVTEPNAANTAYRPGYGLSVSYSDPKNSGGVGLSTATPTEVTITNSYSNLSGSLVITKAFQGPDYLYPDSVEFTVTGPGVYQTLTLSAANNWTAVLGGLSAGEYTVAETVVGGSSYAVSTSWSSPDGKIMVYPGQTATLTCTNVYQENQTLSIRIPVEKAVILGGDMAPSEASIFSFGAAWQGNANVAVRFENAADNTQGALLQTSANTYAVTVQEEGTVKGYIVIEGYAQDLAGFKLQTWEKLTGYASAEAAAAAGWTFDKTATDGTVVWNIQLDDNGYGHIVARVARTDGQATEQVRFENVYTSFYIPPATGDGENPALWTALCAFCLLGASVLLMHHKKAAASVK